MSTFWKFFEGVRRVTVFLLGVTVMIFALIDPESANTVVMLIIGMIMVGILPVENVLNWFPRRRDRRDTDE